MKDKLYNMIVEKEDELYSDDPCMCDSERIEAVVDHLIDSGLVIVLPCAVGDPIFEVQKGNIVQHSLSKNWRIVRYLDEGVFGEIAFTTKEEAEAKLAELKGTEE